WSDGVDVFLHIPRHFLQTSLHLNMSRIYIPELSIDHPTVSIRVVCPIPVVIAPFLAAPYYIGLLFYIVVTLNLLLKYYLNHNLPLRIDLKTSNLNTLPNLSTRLLKLTADY